MRLKCLLKFPSIGSSAHDWKCIRMFFSQCVLVLLKGRYRVTEMNEVLFYRRFDEVQLDLYQKYANKPRKEKAIHNKKPNYIIEYGYY